MEGPARLLWPSPGRQQLSGWAGHIPRRMAEAAGGRPVASPAVERLSCAPSCGRERERPISEWERGRGRRGHAWGRLAFLWAGAVGRTSSRPWSLPSPSRPPRHRRARPLSLAGVQAAGQTASAPASSWGSKDHSGRGRAWWGSKQGCKALLEQRGLREGRGHSSALSPLLGQRHVTGLGPMSRG